MAEIILTPGQRAAVESRGCALLVAAAAGSGKTRVLIDRVLDQVIREGRRVDEFLLITFTQAAAAGLRGKLLAELNRVKPVWVELGLQTIHPASAAYIRRGYDLPVFDAAVKRLKAIGVRVIVHQILGLPGETPEMMAQTSRYIGQAGADGVKLHLLHVLRNTDLAAEWQAGRVQTLELPEYIAALELCLRNLPPEVVIHRLTGDGAKRDLLSPLWSGDKKRVLNAIRRAFERDDLVQGSALSAACKWQHSPT